MRYVIVLGGGPAGVAAAWMAAALGAEVTLCEREPGLLSRWDTATGEVGLPGEAAAAESAASWPRGSGWVEKVWEAVVAEDLAGLLAILGLERQNNGTWRGAAGWPSARAGLLDGLRRRGVRVMTGLRALEAARGPSGYTVWFGEGEAARGTCLVLALGLGGQGPALAGSFGHTIIAPVPTLCSFLVREPDLNRLRGVVMPNARARLLSAGGVPAIAAGGGVELRPNGLAGPAILELSSRAAREIHEAGGTFALEVDWLGPAEGTPYPTRLRRRQGEMARRAVGDDPLFDLPEELWRHLLKKARVPPEARWGGITSRDLHRLLGQLTGERLVVRSRRLDPIDGTMAGGVVLEEVDPFTLESRKAPGLYVAGSLLNADGPAGGHNLLFALATGLLAGREAARGA